MNNNRGSEPVKDDLREIFEVELPEVFNLLLLDISPFDNASPFCKGG